VVSETNGHSASTRLSGTEKKYAGLDISKALIERIVRRFYAKIRTDDVLGPVFESMFQGN
jgi:truncated hemoglobin YjbI